MNFTQNSMAMRQALQNYFQPSDQGVRKRDVLREFVMQGGFRPGIEETAKAIPRDMARFGISAMEAPQALRTGQASREWYNTPIGRVNSFQSEAANRVDRGDPMWKAMGNPMMDTVLAGSDLAGLSAGIGHAMRPAMESMRGVNLPGFVKNPMYMDDALESMTSAKRPFRLWKSDPVIGDMLKKKGYLSVDETMPGNLDTGEWRYSPSVPHSQKPPRPPIDADLFEMQAENPAAREAAGVMNRESAQAIGVPQVGDNAAQAIVPNEGRPVYLPEQGYGKGVLQRLFQGGINKGKYSKDNPAYVMSARKGGEYTRPSMTEIAAAIRRNAPIVTDVASPDVGPLSSVDQGITDILQQAGYMEEAPGVWYPSDNFVNRNAFLKTMPKDVPMRPPLVEDNSVSLFDDTGKMRTKDGQDYYQSNWIGDDYVPMFHKPVKQPRRKTTY